MKKTKKAILLFTAATLILSACSKTTTSGEIETETTARVEATTRETEPETEAPEESRELISTKQLASSIRDKYAGTEKYDYTWPEFDLPRDHVFKDIEIGFNPVDLGHESITEMFNVFADPELKHSVRLSFDMEEIGDNRYSITLKPGQVGALAVSTQMYEDGKNISLGDDSFINEQNNYEDWGNLGQYYLVQWLNLETGEKLEKPIVKVFTIKTELATPQAEYYLTENGSPGFRWNQVKGADTYYILKAQSFNGYVSSAQVIGRTSENSWSPANDDINYMNKMFNNHTADRNAGSEEPLYAYFYAVIAAGDAGTSSVNRLFSEQEIASRLPYSLDITAMNEEDINGRRAESIGLMPAQVPVIMCDDNIIIKTINYEIDNAKVKSEVWATYDLDDNGEMINLKNESVDVLHVPYTIEGTTFRAVLKIEEFDPETYQDELKIIERRQNDLRGRGGSESSSITQLTEQADEEVISDIAVTDDAVFATSALSEYLATNMLAGNTIISLKEFPESSDREYLLDAWYEATYQNPLILGVNGAQIARDNSFIMVSYNEDQKTIAAKQKEIRTEVARVVAEIITPDMSALEKEIAINNYLCDSAEYDFEALKNAEKNNYETVDKAFDDSFTPYGILVNKVGVCASYAGSFKLLADAAGLESIVVTGYLEGSLPHAWNRVKIEDEWISVDTTNNDNPLLANAILNIPDDVAGLLLVEDDRYMGNDFIMDYKAVAGDHEFYRVTESYYSMEQITDRLVEMLQKDGKVTLRTDYILDDNSFQEIAQDVMEEMNIDAVYGFHWMGVITMALESDYLVSE